MKPHRCEDCGTPLVAATGFGLPPTEEVDGRPHTHDGCVEYLKAARMGAERECASLRAERDMLRDAVEAVACLSAKDVAKLPWEAIKVLSHAASLSRQNTATQAPGKDSEGE